MQSKKSYLRDERGIAMVFELVLVAVVLGVVGLAVYQASRHANPVANTQQTPAASAKNATSLATAAAAITEDDSATEASASSTADSLVSDVTASDSDISTLGETADASAF